MRDLRRLFAILVMTSLACSTLGLLPYQATFDTLGKWASGSDSDVEGDAAGGRYELLVKAETGLFWSTAGERFGDGVYEVEATALEGPLDNGFGMMFRMDEDSQSFYEFKVSSDGYVYVGRCADGCDEAVPLVQDGWFTSPVVEQGLNVTNVLRVEANGPELVFFVNDQEVGRVADDTLDKGDIGILVESFGVGGVRVAFDNFTVTPLE
ncbi:MAG: hypothetical protein AB1791_15035 [Chloroflexota bacterium]